MYESFPRPQCHHNVMTLFLLPPNFAKPNPLMKSPINPRREKRRRKERIYMKQYQHEEVGQGKTYAMDAPLQMPMSCIGTAVFPIYLRL